jgi:hypothetical protein
MEYSECLPTLLNPLAERTILFLPGSNSPPMTDTHLEAVLGTMRAANPDVVIIGLYPIATSEKQLLNRIGNLVYSD